MNMVNEAIGAIIMFISHFAMIFSLSVMSVILQEGSVVRAASCAQDFNLKVAHCSHLSLRSVPTDLLPDLRELYLDSNLLTKLDNDSFRRYPNIHTLKLNLNNISLIESGAFAPLKNLVDLDINSNPHLPPLRKSMFDSKSLKELNADYSHLEFLAGDVISSLAHGASISLSGNKLQQINWTSSNSLRTVSLDNNLFRKITRRTLVLNNYVDELVLYGNPIRFIEATAISSLRVKSLVLGDILVTIPQLSMTLFRGISMSKFITGFYLNRVGLHTIDPGFFAPLRGKYLERIYLGMNRLNSIHDNALSDLTKVSEFDLSFNDLQEVEPRHFNGMFALRSLDFSGNLIKTIDTKVDPWNLSITHLDLSGNELREINNSFFRGLTTLQVLDLSGNSELHVIGNNTFANLSSFEDLNLSGIGLLNFFFIGHLPSLSTLTLYKAYCPELILPGNLGSKTPSLARLSLPYSRIHSHDLWDSFNNLSSFSGLQSLLELDLSYNVLTILPVELFHSLTNLQTLQLQKCSLFELGVGIFRNLESLIKLNLDHNYLNVLPIGLFDNMKNLEHLNLQNNGLTYIGSDLFKYNKGLVVLTISSNKLYSFNESTFVPLLNLNVLNIAYNPLVCNCDLKWISGLLKGSVMLRDSVSTICSVSPGTLESFRGKELITFDPSAECDPDIILYTCLVTTGVFLALSLGLVYYHRWWIRYRLFLLKLCFIGYDEIHDNVDRRDFQYDLAIMLHEADDEWVNENLRPALTERVPDFDRIVCGDGELMFGMFYLDAVHYATEQSFKTIVVISRAALQDQWFITKFRTVLDHVNDVGIEKMILLFVEDIVDDELPFLIRLFLSDHRLYLVWPDDERGQEYFWEELVKDLTVNRRCNDLVPPD